MFPSWEDGLQRILLTIDDCTNRRLVHEKMLEGASNVLNYREPFGDIFLGNPAKKEAIMRPESRESLPKFVHPPEIQGENLLPTDPPRELDVGKVITAPLEALICFIDKYYKKKQELLIIGEKFPSDFKIITGPKMGLESIISHLGNVMQR